MATFSRFFSLRRSQIRLEDRAVPAIVAWDGGPTGEGTDWGNPVNWSGDALPGPADDVTIGATGTNPPISLRNTVSVRGVANARILRIVGSNSGGSAALTVGTGGLTNFGELELTDEAANAGAFLSANANVNNASVGTIRVLSGTGGQRQILLGTDADFVNQGTLTVAAALEIVTGGGSSSFDTSGAVAVSTGYTLRPGAAFNYLDGSLAGALDLTGTTVGLARDLSLAAPLNVASFSGTTVNGPGALIVPAGATLTLNGTNAINTALINGGTLVVLANTTVAGPMTSAAGATIRAMGPLFTVRTGLTNYGLFEMFGSVSVIGPAVNAAGGTFRIPTGRAPRLYLSSIDTHFVNEGTFTVQGLFVVSTGLSRGLTNVGTINVPLGSSMDVDGYLTNYYGGDLSFTGGTYNVAGIFRYSGSGILRLAADITLDGPSQFGPDPVNTFINLRWIDSVGRLTLTGGRSLTTTTNLSNSGVLTVGPGSTYTLSSGLTGTGTLRGSGTVTGNLSGTNTVSPGASPGRLTVNGNASTGPFVVELNGTTAGTGYDQLAVNGIVTLGGPLNLSVGFTAPVGTTFRILDNDGTDPVSGTLTALPQNGIVTLGDQTFQINYTDGTGNDVTLTRLPTAPPRVNGVLVNAGQTNAAQRSRVTNLTVNFSAQVTFAGNVGDAFTVFRIGGASVGGFTATAVVVNGLTVVTLSGFTGAETEFGSLADGRYSFLVRANQVSANGFQLDGDANGTGGDDFTINGSVANGLYRLYGDVDGNGMVNAADFGVFRTTFGAPIGQVTYLDFLDFNNDGVVNAFDFTEFRARFGSGVP